MPRPKKDHPDTVVTAPSIKERRYTKPLKCLLTDKELIETGSELSHEIQVLSGIAAELETIKADYKAKSKASDARIQSLTIRMRDKYEMRPVECVEIKNFETKKYLVLRVDTGEEIETRDLREDELQMPLPIGDADGETESTENDATAEEE